MIPDCPECGRELVGFRVLLRRNRWGGGGPRPRPEPWWRCQGCSWLGYEGRLDGRLHRMRHPAGDDADCPFCGGELCAVRSEPWEADGELVQWEVCLACGTSNRLRVRRLG